MPKLSAGLLIFKRTPEIKVFLVHPGGPFWAKKDAGAWSLPKGEYTEDEDPLHAAKREFTEETGQPAPQGETHTLGEVKYGNKKVVAFAVQGDADASNIKSNFIQLEWPPKSGKTQEFPECDRAGWFDLAAAQQKLVPGQIPFAARLAEKLNISVDGPQANQLSLL